MKRQHSKHIFSTRQLNDCYLVENTLDGARFLECDVQRVAKYIRDHSKSDAHYPIGTVIHDAISRAAGMVGMKPADCLPCAEREAALNALVRKGPGARGQGPGKK